jgi:hypothetical protein
MDHDHEGHGMTTHGGHHMLPFFHFTTGDVLWFQDWQSRSPGALLGACIGLFLLGLIERWIAASRTIIELHWDKRCVVRIIMRFFISESVQRSAADRIIQQTKRSSYDAWYSTIHSGTRFLSRGVPSVPIRNSLCIHDDRDVCTLLFVPPHALLIFTRRTFQVIFILAIVVGVGVGETLFGRFADAAADL